MDSNKKKTDELLNLDINFDENITIDNLKDFNLDDHFDSDLNLDFDLELENNSNNNNESKIDKQTNNKKTNNTTKNNKKKKNINSQKEEENINENQFENLLLGFKDKYDINNKKLSVKAIQKNKEERDNSLLISSVIKEHEGDINNSNELDASQYNMLLKNIQIDNKQNIEEKQLNKFQKILGINDLEEDILLEDENDNSIDQKERCNLKYLNLLQDFYLDFENCDFRNNSHLFFLVSKLDNYQLISDISLLKNGDVIKYPVVKYSNETKNETETKNIAIPDLMSVFFIKKFSNKLKVSKHNNCWLIWEDIPIFKKISNLS